MSWSELGGDGRRSNSRFADRRGENQRFYVKTRVPEPFCSFRRSFLCTGAVVSHFVHRRGGFAKLCKTIAPDSENCSSAKSSNTYGNLTVLVHKVRQPRAEWPLFFALSAPPAAAEGDLRCQLPMPAAEGGRRCWPPKAASEASR